MYAYLLALFCTVSLLAAGQGFYIQLKAQLAQYLLQQAWHRTLITGDQQKPWPWADTWPVAKLSVPALDISLIVLHGGSGEAMAFGPAQLRAGAHADSDPSARPANQTPANQTMVIGGHRDTHLAFLQHMQAGQQFEVQTRSGQTQRYQWSEHLIANADTDKLALSRHVGLVLITCYPFSAVQTGGPLRLIVLAEPMPAASAA